MTAIAQREMRMQSGHTPKSNHVI